VGQAEQAVMTEKNDPLLDGSHIQKMIDDCLTQLNPSLAEESARNPSASVPGIRLAAKQTRDMIATISGNSDRDWQTIGR
jgi:hypothetical protein